MRFEVLLLLCETCCTNSCEELKCLQEELANEIWRASTAALLLSTQVSIH